MSVDAVNNREAFASFRAKLNTWRAQINTLTTGLAAAVANITTNTNNIASLTTLVGTKQDANSASTLNSNYAVLPDADYTIASADINAMLIMTTTTMRIITLPPTSTVPLFKIGSSFIVINDESSSNIMRLTAGSGVTLTVGGLSRDISAGQAATVVRTGVNTYKRIY